MVSFCLTLAGDKMSDCLGFADSAPPLNYQENETVIHLKDYRVYKDSLLREWICGMAVLPQMQDQESCPFAFGL